MLQQYGLCFPLNEVWNPEHWQQPGHPGEKCRSNNNCHWFFWARSIMSDSSGAFSRQWQRRVGPLWPLCTTSVWWINAWANGRGPERRCRVRPRPDKRECVCAWSFVSTGGLWHLPNIRAAVFSVYRLELSQIERNQRRRRLPVYD